MSLTGLTSSGHGSLRARLSSPSGFVSVGLALSLLVGSVAVALGQGASKALLDLGDGAVWLPTDPRGVVTLVDGTSGRPTAEIQVATGDGTQLQVVYRDGRAYAYDAATGVLTLIDDASLSSSVAVDTGGTGSTVLVGGGSTYVVDLASGDVQVLDAETLEPAGEPLELGGEVGSVVVDGEGVLWAALTGTGRVVHADAEGVRGTLKVTSGGTAPLTVVGGVVHALDVAAGAVRVLGDGTVSEAMPLGVARDADPDALLVSASSDRDIAVLDPAGCQVSVLAVAARSSADVALPSESCGDDFGAPVVVDDLVFLPNYSTGGTLVLDLTGREAPNEVAVRADGPGEFDLFLDDGNVVANDPSSNEAVIFSGGTEAVDGHQVRRGGGAERHPPRGHPGRPPGAGRPAGPGRDRAAGPRAHQHPHRRAHRRTHGRAHRRADEHVHRRPRRAGPHGHGRLAVAHRHRRAHHHAAAQHHRAAAHHHPAAEHHRAAAHHPAAAVRTCAAGDHRRHRRQPRERDHVPAGSRWRCRGHLRARGRLRRRVAADPADRRHRVHRRPVRRLRRAHLRRDRGRHRRPAHPLRAVGRRTGLPAHQAGHEPAADRPHAELADDRVGPAERQDRPAAVPDRARQRRARWPASRRRATPSSSPGAGSGRARPTRCGCSPATTPAW